MKKTLFTYITAFLCSVIGGSFLLAAAYALPQRSIDKHVEESVAVLAEEGNYPVETPGILGTMRDNYTDAIMLNMASYDSKYPLLQKAFGNYKKRNSDKYAVTWLEHRNDKDAKSVSYARYWHGYLVPLKLLLEVFNYQQIRSLIIFTDLLLIVWICLLMQKKGRNRYIFPFLITLMFFPLNIVGKSLQFSTVFIPVLLEILVMLKYEKNFHAQYGLLFLFSGIVTAYLDLLTYPLVSVGFLLCFAIISDENSRCFGKWKNMVGYTLSWGIGYGGMWASKWLISSLILRENVLKNAVDTAAFRVSTSNGNDTWTHMDVWKVNISNSPKIILVLVLIFVVYLLSRCVQKKTDKINFISNSVFIIIACMPFVWYFIMSNHSYIHSFFTHRELAVSCLAILFYFTSFCGKRAPERS